MGITLSLFRQRYEIIQLMRLDRPYGILLLLLPTLWSLFIASEGSPKTRHLVIFILGACVMRSAGCVANDIADRKWDAHVWRTRNRPLASGRLSLSQAYILLGLLLVLALWLVLLLNLATILLSMIALLVALLYPFAKRITHLSQVVLGVAFSFGIVMAWTATGRAFSTVPLLLWAVNLCWVAGYDTIYALMDREDDLKLGLKSTAILFGSHNGLAVSLLFALSVGLLGVTGRILHLGWAYTLAVIVVAIIFAVQGMWLCRRPSPRALFLLFRSHVFVGFIILIGIILGRPTGT